MFGQTKYECRVEWGMRGAREAAERGDIVIIVDVLSFSTTVVTGVHFGAVIYPYPPSKNGEDQQYAKQVQAEVVAGRSEGKRLQRPSLSPVSFNANHGNKKYILCSLNGSRCSWIAKKVPALLAGCLLNVSAVAEAANQLRSDTGASVTVVPCGEHWDGVKEGENTMRPSIEDYLGAGAILSKLKGSKSPEADVCEGAFQSSKKRLGELIWESGSGMELRERGFGEDVLHAARLDVFNTVPFLVDNYFKNLSSGQQENLT
ncbi:MAG: 2-phosphosulfolactate phosphatase [Bacillota bacterium]|nr:2-phosphosulfolactate phosphatase [Bacillota bacterium]